MRTEAVLSWPGPQNAMVAAAIPCAGIASTSIQTSSVLTNKLIHSIYRKSSCRVCAAPLRDIATMAALNGFGAGRRAQSHRRPGAG